MRKAAEVEVGETEAWGSACGGDTGLQVSRARRKESVNAARWIGPAGFAAPHWLAHQRWLTAFVFRSNFVNLQWEGQPSRRTIQTSAEKKHWIQTKNSFSLSLSQLFLLPHLRSVSLHSLLFFYFYFFAIVIPEVASKWCCGSSSPADPEIGVSAPGGGGVGAPTTPRAPKSGRVKRMVRLAAELLLLLGLLLLTLHITVLRSNPLPQGNVTVSLDQSTALTEVSGGNLWVASLLFFCLV